MRVALVHSSYRQDRPSGENIAVEQQAIQLRAAGHEVAVNLRRTDDMMSTPLYTLRSGVSTLSGVGASPLGALREFEPDVVHVHNLFPNWGRRWLRTWPGPLVATLHNFRTVCAAGTLTRDGHPCELCPQGTSLEAVRHACYRQSSVATVPLAWATRHDAASAPVVRAADRVVVLSEAARRRYIGFGVPNDKLHVVPNFVPAPTAATRARETANWSFIGRLSSEKGLDRALPHWPRTRELDVFGDGPLREAIQEAAPPGVVLHGAVPQADVSQVLQRSRGLLFPSITPEGSPLIYAEALAHGLPVVAATGSSAADDIAAHGTGMVFDHFQEVGDAIEVVERDWERFSARAAARYAEAYAPEIWTEAILDVYEDAIRSHGVITRG